ncbi:MAG: hypothetical protein Q7O66_08220, partial [Dehalococcoidia bacterium]|nr:hypothetical protein [Dehalococcoidia bacterium]
YQGPGRKEGVSRTIHGEPIVLEHDRSTDQLCTAVYSGDEFEPRPKLDDLTAEDAKHLHGNATLKLLLKIGALDDNCRLRRLAEKAAPGQ